MADLLAISERVIDSGHADGPVNRITQELSELDTTLAVVESFSHSILFRTGDGLVVFDASGAQTGPAVVEAIRTWSEDPFHTLVYTHGHVDHVGGSGAFLRDSRARKGVHTQFIGHRRVRDRMHRYRLTNGYNSLINSRQFVGMQGRGYGIGSDNESEVPVFLPADAVEPTITYDDRTSVRVGDMTFELHHAIGETDDHTWGWIPERRAICAGDFFIWNFPNCGNPQKVQRYPLEWARALRDMAAREPELFIPAHGLPIAGRERIAMVLDEVASVLEDLVARTLQMMNAGAVLNDIVHSIDVDPALLERPWLKPLYDEPEFVVNNIWRYYGGWYDGNPAHLKPAREDALAQELAALCGGPARLAARAAELAEAGDYRLACHLVETAAKAAPDHPGVHATRAEIYQARRDRETSMMAKGIFSWAANESAEKAAG